jgi:acetylornithine deacetylase/succinyl-diaminopimelate desuccinylase-like protein
LLVCHVGGDVNSPVSLIPPAVLRPAKRRHTDARHYAARGIPILLYGAGPRTLIEANAHNADENLRLSDLRAATKIVALVVADLIS